MKNIGHQKTISFKENQYFEFTNQQVPNRLKMWKIGLRLFRICLEKLWNDDGDLSVSTKIENMNCALLSLFKFL